MVLEPTEWLWPNWIAARKLHILAGAPGTGKTTVALALAAAVSTGKLWPDGTKAPMGDVAIWSGEDTVEDVLVPRLIAMGADLERVHFLSTARTGGDAVPFDPARHFNLFRDQASRLPALKLLIVDPIVSAVQGDSHQNAEVRRSLQPLVDFGRDIGCAIIGITHFSKGTDGRQPLERVTGSIAFGAVARIVLGTTLLGDSAGHDRALVRLKSNLGPDGGGLSYRLEQVELPADSGTISASKVVWGAAIEGSPRTIFDEIEHRSSKPSAALDAATAFLQALLADGMLSAKDIEEAAAAEGISMSTLRRARNKLGVVAVKDGTSGGWFARLPAGQADNAGVSPSPRVHHEVEDAHDEPLPS